MLYELVRYAVGTENELERALRDDETHWRKNLYESINNPGMILGGPILVGMLAALDKDIMPEQIRAIVFGAVEYRIVFGAVAYWWLDSLVREMDAYSPGLVGRVRGFLTKATEPHDSRGQRRR